jgi:hypothetical protein
MRATEAFNAEARNENVEGGRKGEELKLDGEEKLF